MTKSALLAAVVSAAIVSPSVTFAIEPTPATPQSPAATRTADEILREFSAIAQPTIDLQDGRQPTQDEINAYRNKVMEVAQARAKLAGELLDVAPSHPRASEMIRALIAAGGGPGMRQQVLSRIDAIVEDHPQHADLANLLLIRAQIMIETRLPKAAIESAITDAAKAAPDSPAVGGLWLTYANSAETPEAKRAILNRIIADYPDSPAAKRAAGQIRQVDGVGKPFELAFTDALSGKPISMADLKGKVVVVDFWATWCGPCIAEMPKMKELYAQYKDKGVEFIGVSLDQPEARGGLTKLREYCEKEQITWPQYYQGNYWQSEFSSSWGINSIPRLFIIDADGNLHSTEARGQLEKLIPALIAKRDGNADKQ